MGRGFRKRRQVHSACSPWGRQTCTRRECGSRVGVNSYNLKNFSGGKRMGSMDIEGDGSDIAPLIPESWTPPSDESSLLPKESQIGVTFHRRACAYPNVNPFQVVSPLFSWTAQLENETCSSTQKTVQNNICDW